MNINPLSNTNINQQNYNARKDPNFTSVIPIKVFENKIPLIDNYSVSHIIESLVRRINKSVRANTPSEFKQILLDFDPEFQKNNNIRSGIFDGIPYLFTGQHANTLSDIGSKININPKVRTNYYKCIEEFTKEKYNVALDIFVKRDEKKPTQFLIEKITPDNIGNKIPQTENPKRNNEYYQYELNFNANP
ncbi:MAG: hypothetical protein WCG95_00845 [bacterium]